MTHKSYFGERNLLGGSPIIKSFFFSFAEEKKLITYITKQTKQKFENYNVEKKVPSGFFFKLIRNDAHFFFIVINRSVTV